MLPNKEARLASQFVLCDIAIEFVRKIKHGPTKEHLNSRNWTGA